MNNVSISQSSRKFAAEIVNGLEQLEILGQRDLVLEWQRVQSITWGVALGVYWEYVQTLTTDGRYSLESGAYEVNDIVRMIHEGVVFQDKYEALRISLANWRAQELAQILGITFTEYRTMDEAEVAKRLKEIGYSDKEESYNKGQGSAIDHMISNARSAT
jgi:hypothetical protein